ncbi:hypothetical protein ERICI_02364 [Paenibacillus larvae subsp. larvae]|uniref:Uncharacterized protein n=1 Tax=Paenibacillus larvae subsp. larvae TaxID=147375 RepID=A0A2L1U0S6_9BACL|nr:hypothetical protein ERICI_02364 [Paenibacillus larvae subsp. larvae]AVF26539.1 hypothetical protein ERICIII_02381 [Paenibacillus larvae subsp. larvae]ETK26953.1 hypothetical protein ERIC1_1c03890 [Paenibacillus larvae subsp. larvae DSM 25719]QHZ51868.1 hypothetical protein ERICV_02746 [Paenibacillus larvae subsp. larvae]
MVFLFPKWNRLMKPEESDSSVYQIVAGWGAAPECPLWTHAADISSALYEGHL